VYSIVLAEEHHLDALAAIELAAARLLIGHAPEPVLQEFTARPVLSEAARHRRLWVALAGDAPIGFAHVEILASDLPHLEEIDVHPLHGRRGVGTRLVKAVCAWAREAGYAELTLTTFRDVPWNMPFYARLGFVALSPELLRVELATQVAQEKARGLDPAARVVMAYECARRS
jgi:GNAT superfamily N-acetyltransferase